MLHYSYSGVMSTSDGAHQSTAFQLCEALLNFIASIQSKLHHDIQNGRAQPSLAGFLVGSNIVAMVAYLSYFSLLLALLFGLTMINSVVHSQSLHLTCSYWSGQVNLVDLIQFI